MTNIDDSAIQIMKHARKSLLFDSTGVWVKNDDNPLLDVTMGSFECAKICEFCVLYLLNKISVHIDSDNIGLYRYDRLTVIDNANGPKLDRIRKNIVATFKSKELIITMRQT